jgi:glycine/D-amino acid oxidase-like deaminating enzyme
MGRIFTPAQADFGNTDAVVIGGGIVGTATAFWLSKAGLDVVLLEMRDDQPLIGPVPEVPGFYVNCGYWAGVMLSPEQIHRFRPHLTGMRSNVQYH